MTRFARPLLTSTLILACALTLSACGGGSSNITIPGSGSAGTGTGGTTSTGSSPSTATGLYQIGIAFPLAANNSVYVPPGTQVAASGGVVMTLNLAGSTVNVPGGTMITVPSTATGSPTILVTANSTQPYTANTTLPTVSALAGSASAHQSAVDGTGSGASFVGGGHLAVESNGNVQVSDGGALRQVTPAGVVSTRVAASTALNWQGLAVDQYNNVYGAGGAYNTSATPYGTAIEGINTAGSVWSVRQNWTVSSTNAQLGYGGLAVDSAGNFYLTDAPNNRILKFGTSGVLQIIAGGAASGASDGVGSAATFNNPTDLCIDGSGNLYVSDTGNSAIRKVTPNGTVTTVAKVLTPGAIAATPAGAVYYVGGSPRTLNQLSSSLAASIAYPSTLLADPITGLAVDSAGNVYVGTQGTGAQVFKLSF